MSNFIQHESEYTDFDTSGMDLRDYLKIVYKRRRLIYTSLGLLLLITIILIFTTTPIYTASSQVLIERNSTKSGLENQYYSYDPEFLETQSEIIRSENVAHKVVKNLDLAKKYRHYFFADNKNSAGFFSGMLSKITGLTNTLGSAFSSSAKETGAGTTSAALSESADMRDEDTIAAYIQGGLKVTPVKDTKIVSISFRAQDPVVAQLISDAVVKAYMDEMLEMKLSLSSYSVKWMSSKADEEKSRLESSESGLQKFMRDNDLVTVENKLALLPQKLSDFGSQLTKAEAEKEILQEQIRQIRSEGNTIEKLENLPIFADNAVLKNIRERIYAARQTMQELSKQFGQKHPKMIKINDELRILQDERKSEVDRVVSSVTNKYDLAVAQEKNLADALKNTKSEMLSLNERFMQYSTMKRDADSNRVLYDTLQAGIKKESVTEQAQDVNIWVIKKAKKPLAPSSPNKSRSLLIGLLLGLFSGVTLAFFVEYLDNTVKNHKDLQDRYGLTVLGSIEELKEKGQSIDNYVAQKPLSPLAESYRLIRTGLLLSSAEHPPKKILLTSMSPQEGKTSTTINIARVLAQAASRVLVIDCDLRRPRMNTVLGITSDKGLSSYLAGNHEDKIIIEVPGEQISFMPSGPVPPNPAELLGSTRMKQLVDEMAGQFDFVLLDSPPVESVTDSLALSQYVDGTVLVVRGNKTTFEMLDSGIRKLLDVNARILGFVLNCIKGKDSGNYYYGYSSYYAKDDD
jgi:polysaccharide biosynthesis transport protein